MLKTVFETPGPHRLELTSQILLKSRLFCPKCLSSSGLELTGHDAVRCKNCGFIFSLGASPWGSSVDEKLKPYS
jgi:hypothetical protein